MRRHHVFAAAVLLACTACSSHKTTVATSQGPATVNAGNKTTTITTKEGTLTVGQGVDASNLGVPIYPGATKDDARSMSVQSAHGSSTMASFTTTDPFERVYAFYKSKLPEGAEKMKMSAGGTSTALFVVGDDKSPSETTVQISAKTGSTQIVITQGAKK